MSEYETAVESFEEEQKRLLEESTIRVVKRGAFYMCLKCGNAITDIDLPFHSLSCNKKNDHTHTWGDPEYRRILGQTTTFLYSCAGCDLRRKVILEGKVTSWPEDYMTNPDSFTNPVLEDVVQEDSIPLVPGSSGTQT